MIVHITSTYEFEKDELNAVVETLNKINGPIEFKNSPPLTLKQQEIIFADFKEMASFSFDDYFKLCKSYRAFNNNISDNEFLVIISTIPNELNWFSAFRDKNIFVDGGNWEHFTTKDSKYGIAFQVAENIFQSMIGLKIEGGVDPLIHMKPIGCVNDMTSSKKDITLKFITGHICDACYARAEETIDDQFILEHLANIFNQLRNEFIKRGNKPERFIPEPLIEDKDIKIGNLKFSLQPVHQSFYFYFIQNRNGVITSEINKKVDEIYEIYKNLRNNAEYSSIASAFGYKLKSDNILGDLETVYNGFEQIRSKIKIKLSETLGEELCKYYLIDTFDDKKSKIYIIQQFIKKPTQN